jgi:hypothetical protein
VTVPSSAAGVHVMDTERLQKLAALYFSVNAADLYAPDAK